MIGGGLNVAEKRDNIGFEFERRDIEATKDFYDHAIRLSAGELDPLVTGFQGGQQLLGFGVARRFGVIRPFENLQPSGRGEIVLERDSTVDVEVNGVLVETIELSAGRYALRDFPFATGANDVRLVVTDETGTREIARLSLYNEPDLLDPGIVDFSLAVGLPRDGDIDEYADSPVGTGYVRVGATNWLTLGVNAQASEEVGQAGIEAAFGSPFGTFNTEGAYSWNEVHGETGYAVAVDYSESLSLFDADDLRLGGTVLWESESFTGLTSFTGDDDGVFNSREFDAVGRFDLRLPIGASLGVTGGYTKFRDDAPDEITSGVSIGTNLGPVGVSVSGAMIDAGGDRDFSGFLGLSYRFGDRYSARARYASQDNRTEVELSRAPRSELHDVSGRVRLGRENGDGDGDYIAAAELAYYGNRFEAELDTDVSVSDGIDGETRQISQIRATTGIGFAGGKLAIGRPFRSGFIIADTHETLGDSNLALTSASGRRVEAETDILGAALVPIDRPYGVNKLGVEVDPLPMGYDIGAGVIEVFPGAGSGYAFTIGSDASRTLMGYLKTEADEPLELVVGTLEPENGDESLKRQFFTNRSGRFIADKVAPGAYRLVLDGRIIGVVDVPDDGEALIDVGLITVAEPQG